MRNMDMLKPPSHSELNTDTKARIENMLSCSSSTHDAWNGTHASTSHTKNGDATYCSAIFDRYLRTTASRGEFRSAAASRSH